MKNLSVHYSSDNPCWGTPPSVFDPLNEKYRFDLDVCALPENAKCSTYYSPEVDGLKQTWAGTCWMNPPYGREIGAWVKKARDEFQAGRARVVCLLPARTDTEWFHSYVKPYARIEFLKGRVRFVGAKNGAPFPSMLAYYGC